jgi:hypothetical protein
MYNGDHYQGRNIMQFRIGLVLLLVFSCAILAAQEPGPRGQAAASIGGKSVVIEYGRPALKGRSMDELFKQLPPDRVWRAGLDQVTTLMTAGDIMVGDKKIPTGKYSVYVYVPEKGDWALILNTDPGIELGKIWPDAPAAVAKACWPYYEDYTDKIGSKEVARVAMKSAKLTQPVDLFTIELTPQQNSALLKMSWGDRSASLELAPAK